jgi:hypothetical protein
MLPDEPEAGGLLALLLLHDARIDAAGELVSLEDQDRSRWDASQIAEGTRLLEAALRRGRPGPYQVQAAIAACCRPPAPTSSAAWAAATRRRSPTGRRSSWHPPSPNAATSPGGSPRQPARSGSRRIAANLSVRVPVVRRWSSHPPREGASWTSCIPATAPPSPSTGWARARRSSWSAARRPPGRSMPNWPSCWRRTSRCSTTTGGGAATAATLPRTRSSGRSRTSRPSSPRPEGRRRSSGTPPARSWPCTRRRPACRRPGWPCGSRRS